MLCIDQRKTPGGAISSATWATWARCAIGVKRREHNTGSRIAPERSSPWARVEVKRDAHGPFQLVYHSVPFRLAGRDLWLKATATMARLYCEHELSAPHVRQTARGMRTTVANYNAPVAQA
ncbi:Mu transposase domain-containing protein [Paraburkholderia rhynchosiae]|uniref:Transposase for insertion sequence element IS21-like C-terminal domain-containing protein n=1 Tax=Paraburkholderia rhynchosiae TaxID=487049 RepID=A0A6J5CEG3_9BURK|nr:hypothetical protein [Paraburkholderia rhynchosiae]CAB3733753.1 hypothetical protein LMG27174_06050 [Paraburkholderia rhynchosiae]